jgi:diguanylate cyclase (GGDEF)-like protein
MTTPPRREPSEVGASLYSTTQIRHLMRVEFSRAQRYSYPLGVLVLQLDHLERLRDLHGFERVSEAVESLARMVRERTRVCDHLGRLVDERLVTVLPHTNRAGTVALAERLVAAVRDQQVAGLRSDTPLSLSVGATSFEREGTMFFDVLMEAAERSLERARAAGGGRVVALDPGEAS